MFYYLSAKFLHFINYFLNTNENDKKINDLEILVYELKKQLVSIKTQLEKKHIIDSVKKDFYSRIRDLFPHTPHQHHLYMITEGQYKHNRCDFSVDL